MIILEVMTFLVLVFIIYGAGSLLGFASGYRQGKKKAIDKANKFNQLIKAQNNPLLEEEWNTYLNAVSSSTNDLSFFDWVKGLT